MKFITGHEINKGRVPWNKGRRGLQQAWNKVVSDRLCATCGIKFHVAPSRLRDKRVKRGVYCSRNCKDQALVDKRPWNHGLGMTPEETRIRYSKEYKEWRKAVFTRDGFMCVWCRETTNLEADHIKPFALFPKLRLTVDNGRTLCFGCHKTTDTYGGRRVYA